MILDVGAIFHGHGGEYAFDMAVIDLHEISVWNESQLLAPLHKLLDHSVFEQ